MDDGNTKERGWMSFQKLAWVLLNYVGSLYADIIGDHITTIGSMLMKDNSFGENDVRSRMFSQSRQGTSQELIATTQHTYL